MLLSIQPNSVVFFDLFASFGEVIDGSDDAVSKSISGNPLAVVNILWLEDLMQPMEIVQQIQYGIFVFLSLPRFACMLALLDKGTLGADATLFNLSMMTQCFGRLDNSLSAGLFETE